MAPSESGYRIRSEAPGRLAGWLSRNEVSIAVALGIILAARLWISPLPSGFWIDETGTVWAITGGIKEVIARWRADFPEMPLFTILTWAWSRVAGVSEAALRVPSVIEMSMAVVLIRRAARRLTDRLTAAYILLVLASLSHVSFAAADARPYSLAIFCLAWAFFESVQWAQTGRSVHLAFQGVALGLAMNSHYLFAIPIAANIIFIVLAHRRRWIQMRPVVLISPLLSLITIVPAIPLLLGIARDQQIHVVAVQPSWTDLGVALVPPRWIVAAVLGVGVTWILSQRKMPAPATVDTRITAMPVIWMVAPAVVLFAYSLLSGVPVMLPRYLLSQTPGIVLLGAYMLTRLRTAELRITIAVILFVICIAGGGRTLWTRHDTEDWRGASAAINRLRKDDVSTPVLMGSSFTESGRIPMPVPADVQDFLLAPLKPYPVEGPVTLLPIEMNSLNSQYVHSVFESAADSTRFVVLIPAASRLTQWVYGRFDREFTISEIQPNPIVLLLVRRVSPRPDRDREPRQ